MELAYHNADELMITTNMRERKATMEARADAFLALPGGVGTMEEVFEIMAARSLQSAAQAAGACSTSSISTIR